jgi:hypothetical protein
MTGQPILTASELYAVARAAAGMPWQDVPIAPVVRLLLEHLQPNDTTTLLRLLGPDLSAQVLLMDATAPPPIPAERPQPNDAALSIPPLPMEAQLSDHAVQAAETVGNWLTEALQWATMRSPMTPFTFLTVGLIWTLGLAIARRCTLPLHKPIFPHLYVLWVAPTSIFKMPMRRTHAPSPTTCCVARIVPTPPCIPTTLGCMCKPRKLHSVWRSWIGAMRARKVNRRSSLGIERKRNRSRRPGGRRPTTCWMHSTGATTAKPRAASTTCCAASLKG